MTELPATLHGLDAEWVQREFRAAGHEVTISDVAINPLPGFLGVMGEVMTLDVTYASPSDLPTTFIAKCPRDDELASLMNMVMQSYHREHGFYRDLAGSISLEIPRCYVNLHDAETGRAVLIIERIEGEPGDLLAGCSIDQMRQLLSLLAGMHGRHWMSDALLDLDWIFDWQSPPWSMGADMVRHHWPLLLERRPDLMSPELKASFERNYVNDIEGALVEMQARPWTLAHADYELDNVIFRDGRPVIIDWQSGIRSFPGLDVAWLLATAERDDLIAAEAELLDHYLAELAASGGPTWTREDLLTDMCNGLNFYVVGMSIPIDQNADADYGDDRQHDRLEAMFLRGIRAAERWGYVERMR